MAKENGLGQSMFIAGVDISDDVREWNASGGPALLDFTSINKSAMVRKGGLHTAGIGATLFFNDAIGESFQTLKAMPSTDRIISLLTGNTLGDAAWCLTGKQSDLAFTRAPDGMFTLNLPALSNLRRGHWTQSLLAGKVTHASPTNGGGVDGGRQGSVLTVTGGSAANPTVVTIASHGLVTGDSIEIIGTDKAALNGNHTVTVVNANTFTVPVDLSGGAAGAGTAYKTSTNYGLSAYLHAFSLASGTAELKLQDSADDSTYADLTGGGFTNVTAQTSEVIETTATRIVRRYVRVISGGTFSDLVFWAGFCRHLALSIDS